MQRSAVQNPWVGMWKRKKWEDRSLQKKYLISKNNLYKLLLISKLILN